MGYPFEQIFAADPGTPGNVAAYASIIIFTPGDATMTPLPLTKLDGSPLANPLTTSGVGATTSFIADIEQVAWDGGGYSGLFTSYVGMRDETALARTAAQTAASAASTSASDASSSASSASASAASAAAIAARGMPSGGSTGQVLAKTSGTNYAAGWIDPPEGGGGGSGGTSSTMLHRYTGSGYPTLPSSKPAGVSIVDAIGPTYPTSLPSWVGFGPTQIPLRYSYAQVL